MTIAERVALRGLGHFDADPDAAGLITALDEQVALRAIQRLRATVAELRRPRLLDVGCGTDEVVSSLAGLVRADVAISAGAVTADEGTSWLADLTHAGTTGGFFWAVTMCALGGVRPSLSSAALMN